MSWWKRLLRGTDRRAIEDDERLSESMAAAIGATGDQLKTVRAAIERLAADVRAVERQHERLIALRKGEGDAPARLDRLERTLDTTRVITHLGQAAAQGEFADDPVSHLVIANLLPDEAYEALVDAVPAPLFFAGDIGTGQELPLPLALAPVHSMVAWNFVGTVVRKALGPAILARFEEAPAPLMQHSPQFVTKPAAPLVASRGHLAQRRRGDAIPGDRHRARQVLTTVVPLVAGTESVDVRLKRLDRDSGPRSAVSVPCKTLSLPRNSALTIVNASGSIEFAALAPAANLYTYEFAIGPLSRDL